MLAYFLGTLLSPSSRAPRWQAPFGMALLCGILLACFIKSGLTVKRYGESPILAAAAIINQVPNPIVFNSLFANPVLRFEQVDNTAIGDIFSLSYHLNPDVILQLVPNLSALDTKTINPGDFLFFVSHSPENAIHATTLTGVKAFFKPIDIANSEKTILFQADSNVSE